ncbi:MAG: GTP cyclohydrolase I FolE [Proteobacteria bacterium]|nr:GTP cyclohydrolase I FolE [Pseudomonadota bacterium]
MTEPVQLHAMTTDDARNKELERLFRRFLEIVEPESGRQGLAETPQRMAKAWGEWTAGYAEDPADILKTFDDGAENVDEMVLVRDIPVYSHCEHHLAPIIGVAHVAYIPSGKIVGLSKLARLVNVYARRLQVQERLTNQIADALNDNLSPLGVGVILKCRHMCMESRGIRTPGALTVTSALRGCVKDEPDCRAEFLELCR